MLYNRLGDKDEAENLLREVVTAHPELYEIAYSLGLLLAEEKQYDEATLYLERAAQGMPERARVHYNLGVLLDYPQRNSEAEKALLRALELDPDQIDYLVAAAEFYLKRKRFPEARRIAEHMIRKHPSNQTGYRILDFIPQNTSP